MQTPIIVRILVDPGQLLKDLSRRDPESLQVLQGLWFFLLLIPPLTAAIGGMLFGWRFGTPEPLYLSVEQSITISFLYFLALSFGFFSTVIIARWMGATYGAFASTEVYLALLSVVAAPLSIGSLAHLFPHIFFNVLVMIPAVIWSMTLLYRGLPVVLGIPPERGMLMSSALVGWLLVAAVALLGISAGLWTAGLGPAIRV